MGASSGTNTAGLVASSTPDISARQFTSEGAINFSPASQGIPPTLYSTTSTSSQNGSSGSSGSSGYSPVLLDHATMFSCLEQLKWRICIAFSLQTMSEIDSETVLQEWRLLNEEHIEGEEIQREKSGSEGCEGEKDDKTNTSQHIPKSQGRGSYDEEGVAMGTLEHGGQRTYFSSSLNIPINASTISSTITNPANSSNTIPLPSTATTLAHLRSPAVPVPNNTPLPSPLMQSLNSNMGSRTRSTSSLSPLTSSTSTSSLSPSSSSSLSSSSSSSLPFDSTNGLGTISLINMELGTVVHSEQSLHPPALTPANTTTAPLIMNYPTNSSYRKPGTGKSQLGKSILSTSSHTTLPIAKGHNTPVQTYATAFQRSSIKPRSLLQTPQLHRINDVDNNTSASYLQGYPYYTSNKPKVSILDLTHSSQSCVSSSTFNRVEACQTLDELVYASPVLGTFLKAAYLLTEVALVFALPTDEDLQAGLQLSLAFWAALSADGYQARLNLASQSVTPFLSRRRIGEETTPRTPFDSALDEDTNVFLGLPNSPLPGSGGGGIESGGAGSSGGGNAMGIDTDLMYGHVTAADYSSSVHQGRQHPWRPSPLPSSSSSSTFSSSSSSASPHTATQNSLNQTVANTISYSLSTSPYFLGRRLGQHPTVPFPSSHLLGRHGRRGAVVAALIESRLRSNEVPLHPSPVEVLADTGEDSPTTNALLTRGSAVSAGGGKGGILYFPVLGDKSDTSGSASGLPTLPTSSITNASNTGSNSMENDNATNNKNSYNNSNINNVHANNNNRTYANDDSFIPTFMRSDSLRSTTRSSDDDTDPMTNRQSVRYLLPFRIQHIVPSILGQVLDAHSRAIAEACGFVLDHRLLATSIDIHYVNKSDSTLPPSNSQDDDIYYFGEGEGLSEPWSEIEGVRAVLSGNSLSVLLSTLVSFCKFEIDLAIGAIGKVIDTLSRRYNALLIQLEKLCDDCIDAHIAAISNAPRDRLATELQRVSPSFTSSSSTLSFPSLLLATLPQPIAVTPDNLARYSLSNASSLDRLYLNLYGPSPHTPNIANKLRTTTNLFLFSKLRLIEALLAYYLFALAALQVHVDTIPLKYRQGLLWSQRGSGGLGQGMMGGSVGLGYNSAISGPFGLRLGRDPDSEQRHASLSGQQAQASATVDDVLGLNKTNVASNSTQQPASATGAFPGPPSRRNSLSGSFSRMSRSKAVSSSQCLATAAAFTVLPLLPARAGFAQTPPLSPSAYSDGPSQNGLSIPPLKTLRSMSGGSSHTLGVPQTVIFGNFSPPLLSSNPSGPSISRGACGNNNSPHLQSLRSLAHPSVLIGACDDHDLIHYIDEKTIPSSLQPQHHHSSQHQQLQKGQEPQSEMATSPTTQSSPSSPTSLTLRALLRRRMLLTLFPRRSLTLDEAVLALARAYAEPLQFTSMARPDNARQIYPSIFKHAAEALSVDQGLTLLDVMDLFITITTHVLTYWSVQEDPSATVLRLQHSPSHSASSSSQTQQQSNSDSNHQQESQHHLTSSFSTSLLNAAHSSVPSFSHTAQVRAILGSDAVPSMINSESMGAYNDVAFQASTLLCELIRSCDTWARYLPSIQRLLQNHCALEPKVLSLVTQSRVASLSRKNQLTDVNGGGLSYSNSVPDVNQAFPADSPIATLLSPHFPQNNDTLASNSTYANDCGCDNNMAQHSIFTFLPRHRLANRLTTDARSALQQAIGFMYSQFIATSLSCSLPTFSYLGSSLANSTTTCLSSSSYIASTQADALMLPHDGCMGKLIYHMTHAAAWSTASIIVEARGLCVDLRGALRACDDDLSYTRLLQWLVPDYLQRLAQVCETWMGYDDGTLTIALLSCIKELTKNRGARARGVMGNEIGLKLVKDSAKLVATYLGHKSASRRKRGRSHVRGVGYGESAMGGKRIRVESDRTAMRGSQFKEENEGDRKLGSVGGEMDGAVGTAVKAKVARGLLRGKGIIEDDELAGRLRDSHSNNHIPTKGDARRRGLSAIEGVSNGDEDSDSYRVSDLDDGEEIDEDDEDDDDTSVFGGNRAGANEAKMRRNENKIQATALCLDIASKYV